LTAQKLSSTELVLALGSVCHSVSQKISRKLAGGFTYNSCMYMCQSHCKFLCCGWSSSD